RIDKTRVGTRSPLFTSLMIDPTGDRLTPLGSILQLKGNGHSGAGLYSAGKRGTATCKCRKSLPCAPMRTHPTNIGLIIEAHGRNNVTNRDQSLRVGRRTFLGATVVGMASAVAPRATLAQLSVASAPAAPAGAVTALTSEHLVGSVVNYAYAVKAGPL